MGKRYYKGPSEPGSSDLEYIEFTDGQPTRQIDIVDGRYYSSLEDPVRDQFGDVVGGGLGDQSLYSLALPDEWEISAEEFEEAWQRMLKTRG